ncbi:MAG: alpha/beta hydrolase [Micavibrio sp.]|nr:alpha/beta hydrolase [Micavibrio sp.]
MNFNEAFITSENGGETHRIYYREWGDESGIPLICVHGLTGNGYDFDYIAPTLVEQGYRVIAVDLPGRGRSDFLSDPMLYNYDIYIADLIGLIAHFGFKKVDWLGVSLGGLLGMCIAAEENTPIKRLILNDVGPEVPKAALDFIYNVIKQPYYFESIDELEKRMRATRGLTWGPVTDEQWTHMAKHNARETDDGRITYAYDPEIARIFETAPLGTLDMWECWDAIDCPTLVIQGKKSMLLTKKILKKMKKRGPEYDLLVFKGCGHVPSLMAPEQIEAVRGWLACN